MYCNYCGKVIQDDANHCAYCGKQVGVPVRKHLVRPLKGRYIAGVTRAFADYFDLDVSLIRVIWLLVAFFGGTGILAYVVCWIVIPSEEAEPSAAQAAPNASPVSNSSMTTT